MSGRKKRTEETGSWMDTYGDMVTLLLCFFVMLYAISNVDKGKWEKLVGSLNPDAIQEETGTGYGFSQVSEIEMEDEIEFDQLYEILKKTADEMELEEYVEIYKGDGFTFITFQNQIFFDGNSSVLKEEGKQVLDEFAVVLHKAASSIKEIQVLGHTAEAANEEDNHPESDRILSSDRAARVTAYLELKDIVEPSRLVSIGYGMWRPVVPSDSEENRAKNRRVELIITEDDAVSRALDEYYQEVYGVEE